MAREAKRPGLEALGPGFGVSINDIRSGDGGIAGFPASKPSQVAGDPVFRDDTCLIHFLSANVRIAWLRCRPGAASGVS